MCKWLISNESRLYKGKRLDEGGRKEAPKGIPGGWSLRRSGDWENSITSSWICRKPAVYARQEGTLGNSLLQFFAPIQLHGHHVTGPPPKVSLATEGMSCRALAVKHRSPHLLTCSSLDTIHVLSPWGPSTENVWASLERSSENINNLPYWLEDYCDSTTGTSSIHWEWCFSSSWSEMLFELSFPTCTFQFWKVFVIIVLLWHHLQA